MPKSLWKRAERQFAALGVEQLRERIVAEWERHGPSLKKRFGPLLYYLREKLKKPGSRTGEGFGSWVEQNLPFSRRTADRWADEYGVAVGLIKTFRQPVQRFVPSPKDDDLYSIEFAFEPNELREFKQAYRSLGKPEAQRVIYEAVIEAAKAKPKARRAASGV
jgi:hypothetical protein